MASLVRWLIVFAALGACTTSELGPGIDVTRALADIEHLTAIGPRPRDSDGSRAAAGYIEDELRRLGLAVERMPVGRVDVPEIRVLGRLHRAARTEHTTDPNVLVRFGPPGKALLVMAHYDTVARSPGAIDNAVAVALVLELARSLRERAPPQPVVLAFTANEEIGLVGAEALAAHRGDEIEFAIALDLLGGDGELTLNGASELIGRAELRWLADAADRAGVALGAPLSHRVVSRWWPQAERSDHGPFTRRGIRAVHFYNRGNDGEWIDLAYHSTRDTPVRIDRDSLAATGRLLRALVASPVPAPAGDGFWLPFAVNTVVPRWLLIAGELVLVLVVLVALGGGRDGVVAWIARARSGRRAPAGTATESTRGPGVLVGAVCYALAIVIACVAEGALAGAHPAPWLHAPVESLIADALVLAGTFGLATRGVARVRPWRGDQRYLALAALVPAITGVLALAIGAAELAWIWLVPAAVIALAPRLGRARVLAVASAAWPIVAILHPFRLREAAWNAFLPPSLPLSLWLAVLAIPLVSTIVWWLRCRRPAGPLGTLVLGVGCGLAVVVGLVFAVTIDPACSAVKFESFHLACERV